MTSEQSESEVERVDTLDEVELSVHHRIGHHTMVSSKEYEIHAGHADVIEIPRRLAETVKEVTGVDLTVRSVRCAAEIRVVDE
jgi:hypothetical protein